MKFSILKIFIAFIAIGGIFCLWLLVTAPGNAYHVLGIGDEYRVRHLKFLLPNGDFELDDKELKILTYQN